MDARSGPTVTYDRYEGYTSLSRPRHLGRALAYDFAVAQAVSSNVAECINGRSHVSAVEHQTSVRPPWKIEGGKSKKSTRSIDTETEVHNLVNAAMANLQLIT